MIKTITSLLDTNSRYTLEDLDCSLCLYYGGKEIEAAQRRKKRI